VVPRTGLNAAQASKQNVNSSLSSLCEREQPTELTSIRHRQQAGLGVSELEVLVCEFFAILRR
jgi:hypothetical protein